MKTWNINITSERKHREMMKRHLEDMKITAEAVPFSFNVKRGQEIRLAPMACVVDLLTVIFHLLNEKEWYIIVVSLKFRITCIHVHAG